MPRVAKQERVRKETAFEALEDVLREAGRLRRPSPADEGFKAVIQAICLWKDLKAWTDVTEEERASLLETHSSWRKYRRKRGPSSDIDPTNFAGYKEELGKLFRAESPNGDGSGGSSRSSGGVYVGAGVSAGARVGAGGGGGLDGCRCGGGGGGDSDTYFGGARAEVAAGGVKRNACSGSYQRMKEAAFEALEQALGEVGRERRPSATDKGYEAVTQAICFWKGVDAWGDLAPEEQTTALKALSYWTTSRRKRGSPHPDVDRSVVESFKPRLAILLVKAARPSPLSEFPVAAASFNPTPAAIPAPVPFLPSLEPVPPSFSGGAHAFGEWTKQHYPAKEYPPKRKRLAETKTPVRRHPSGPGGTALVVRHFVAGSTTGESHLDFINADGRMVCSKQRHEWRAGERADAVDEKPPCACTACDEAAISSISVAELNPPSLKRGPVTVRHRAHHDVLVPTNRERTEFAIMCPEKSEFAAVCQEISERFKSQIGFCVTGSQETSAEAHTQASARKDVTQRMPPPDPTFPSSGGKRSRADSSCGCCSALGGDEFDLGPFASPCGFDMADLANPASLLEWCDSIQLIPDNEFEAISGMLHDP